MDRKRSYPDPDPLRCRLPTLSRPPSPVLPPGEPRPVPDETYSPEELQQITRTLAEYNIEISIRSRRDKTRIFEFREGQGNLKIGLTITDRVLKEKFGIDLGRLLDSLDRR